MARASRHGRRATTARERRRPLRLVSTVAAAGLALGGLAACSGSSSGAGGPSAPTSTAPSGSGTPGSSSTAGSTGSTGSTGTQAGAPHSSAVAVVSAFYTAVAKGDFATACSLIDPSVIPQLLEKFGSCQLALERHYTPALRATLSEVKIDPGKVAVVGDGASIPQDAITFGGSPSKDGDQQAIRVNGKWFLTSPPGPNDH